VSARTLAALARFVSETQRPLHDRDSEVIREAVARLSHRSQRNLAAEVNAYLTQHPHASANEVCVEVGARRSEVLALMRAARGRPCGDHNGAGGDCARSAADYLSRPLGRVVSQFPSTEPLGGRA